MIKNKKAGERLLSIYLFIIYIIVIIGLVSGIINFKDSSLDVRNKEAGVLTDKVIDCLVEQGRLREDFFEADFDLIAECDFNFKDNTEKYLGEERYAVRVDSFYFENKKALKNVEAGKTDLLTYCGLEGEKIPKCNIKELYVLDVLDDKILLKVISVVGKVENV